MAIAAYESCFYAAKAFCYFLGFASLGRSAKKFVDAFASTERKVGRNKIVVHDTLKIHNLKDRLTHDLLWSLAERLIVTTIFPAQLQQSQQYLKLVDWNHFSSFRNRVMYDGAFWPLSHELDRCDLVVNSPIDEFRGIARLEDAASPPFAAEYFQVARQFQSLIAGMLADIGGVAPAVLREARAIESSEVRGAA